MLEFMDYVQQAFYRASNWNEENSYSNLTATARALLDFHTPLGLRINVSSLSSPHIATSYNLGSVGSVDGSLSYLYSSTPLHPPSKSASIDLPSVILGYHQIQELHKPQDSWEWEIWHHGKRIDRRDLLLYGRMYLPQSTLEALYMRRISPTQQLKLSAVSDKRMKNGGTVLAMHQYNTGKYGCESLYSSDGGLLGIRGLYNFGPDPRKGETGPSAKAVDDTRFYGRFSAGAELYYGALNKSGGVSVGGRFQTLPAHRGAPITTTLTLNPLMGNFSTTYAVKAGPHLAFCSRFDFNVYSYESDVMAGFELWKMKTKIEQKRERSMAAKLAWRLDDPRDFPEEPEEVAGVLKARINQHGKIGVLWEGRIKELLFTLGSSFDMKRRDAPFRTLGLELQYSS